MRYAVKFAYDGKKFLGYARQKEGRTVEGDIINALREINAIEGARAACFQSASRTDRGVSALCNVVAFNTELKKQNIIPAVNAHVRDIWLYGIKEVDEWFNPRYANQRWYRYLILRDSLDIARMKECTKIFLGTYDFSNFATVSEKNPVRKIDYFRIKEKGIFLIVDIKAESFLWHMVRKIISAVEKVGLKKMDIADVRDMLLSQRKFFNLPLAKPEPLILMDIKYNFRFETCIKSGGKIKALLEDKINSLLIEKEFLECFKYSLKYISK